MATAAAARGSLVEFGLKDEATFGALPSGDWQKTLIYSSTLNETAPLEDDPLLGQARQNSRDQTASAPGLPEMGGGIVAPLDLNHSWFWLKGALGDPTSSGSDPDYTHTFNSGGEVLPHRSVETRLKSGLFLTHSGLLVDRLEFEASRAGNYARKTVTFAAGYKERKATSTNMGTPPTILARDPLFAALAVFKMNTGSGMTTVADVLSCRVTYDNRAVANDALGDSEGRILGHDLDMEATLTATIEMRFRSFTMYDLAAAGTNFAAELLWQRTSARSLSLQFDVARLQAQGVPVGGQGRMTQTFTMRAHQDSSNPMLTAVLKNGTAAAAYA